MDKIRDFPDGSRAAVILALFPLAWKPDARHRSLTGTLKSSGYFSVKDTARSMHGFVPERSFGKAAQSAAAYVTWLALRVQIRLELFGVCRPPACAVELGTLLYGQRHVVDVTFHAGRGLQRHSHCANDPGGPATHDHSLGGDGARHLALLADDDLSASHVALDLAVHLQRATADDLESLADDLEVVADDGLACLAWLGAADLRLRAWTGFRNRRLDR